MVPRTHALTLLTLAALGGPAAGDAFKIRGAWYNFYQLSGKKADAEPEIRKNLAAFAKAGVNMIYVLVKTPDGYAHYKSRVCPERPGQDWDPLAFTVVECKKNGIAVHAYLNTFCDGKDVRGKDPAAFINKHPEYIEVSDNGKSTHWLSPAIPEVRQHELDAYLEVVKNYDIKGIHLDRIRYGSRGDPEEGAGGIPGYNPIALKLYKDETGKDPDEKDDAWLKWRQDQVTKFVRECRKEIKAAKPSLEFSASVFPDPASAAKNQHQNWAVWVREGLLDSVCPMNYATKPELFEKRALAEKDAVKGKIPLLVGLGAYLLEKDPQQLADQIKFCRSHGIPGVVLFNGYCLMKSKIADAVKGAWQ